MFRIRVGLAVVEMLQPDVPAILDPMTHTHGPSALGRLRHLARPHSHEAADRVDAAMEASAEGMRALWISLAVTALVQAAVVAVSGSVALLGDTLHNAADALTAVPLGIAFLVARRRPNRRYTYGYGRAEDLAGVVIVLVIAASSALAAYEAVTRLAHPRPVSNLLAVAVAPLAGFTGNELVARYRIRARGPRDLPAPDGRGRPGPWSTRGEQALRATPGVLGAGQVRRLRWTGHQLRAECEVTVDAGASAVGAHQVAVGAGHSLLHALPRLTAALVHADPQPEAGTDHHAVLASHR